MSGGAGLSRARQGRVRHYCEQSPSSLPDEVEQSLPEDDSDALLREDALDLLDALEADFADAFEAFDAAFAVLTVANVGAA